jgi:hypothetical protein
VDEAKEVSRKLDVIISLLAARAVIGKSKTEAIQELGRCGLDRASIATITGVSPEAVSVRLSEAKRKRPKRGRK